MWGLECRHEEFPRNSPCDTPANIKIAFFMWDLARQNKILHFQKKTLVSNYVDA